MLPQRLTRADAIMGACGATAILVVLLSMVAQAWAAPLTKVQMSDMLRTIDARQQSVGDYRAQVFIDQKQKGKAQLVYEAAIYRRDAQDKLVILFLKPKSEAGKGYLRLDQNLFLYDPGVGKWERRTERESIGGTDSRRRDFDASTLSEDYTPTYVGSEELGKYEVHHLELKAKSGRDVAYPTLHIWVDQESTNLLKIQEYALSGRLMRTSYYPKWSTVDGQEGKKVYFPKEIRIFDEIEKENSTTIVTRSVSLDALPSNIFTKAWLESKSR